MKIFKLVAIFYVFLPSFMVFGQEKYDPLKKGMNDTILVALTKVDNEMIPWIPVPEVHIIDYRIFKSAAERAKFNRLRYNVLKVLPYSTFARNRYAQLQRDLALTHNKKEQRRLMKAFEREIKDMFNREIKNLTITQGEILIKLIDRETGNSSYELLKEMKGNFSAFFYQSVARIFGHNLKSEYDPQEDRDIENIIQSSAYYMYYN